MSTQLASNSQQVGMWRSPKGERPYFDMTWTEKPFTHNGATCSGCGGRIAQGEKGWTNPEAPAKKKVRCLTCGPGDVSMHSDPIPGSSALRQDKRYRGDKNLKGAIGEYRMGEFLRTGLTPWGRVLTDRRLPGESEANIDHTVIAPSGVWIIDSKKWEGIIKYRAASFPSTSPTRHLTVGGTEYTSHIAKIYRLVIPVAQVIGNRGISLKPAMAFIDGEWGLLELRHLQQHGPYEHDGVYISDGHLLIEKINKPGPLDLEAIEVLYRKLDAAMPPR